MMFSGASFSVGSRACARPAVFLAWAACISAAVVVPGCGGASRDETPLELFVSNIPISGPIEVSASVEDARRLMSLSLVVDNRADTRVTLYEPPFGVVYEPNEVPDGVHTVYARAVWRSGRVAEAEARFSTDNQPPIVRTVSPAPETIVTPPWEVAVQFDVDESSGLLEGWIQAEGGVRADVDLDTMAARAPLPAPTTLPAETRLVWSFEDRAGNTSSGEVSYTLSHIALSARLGLETPLVRAGALDRSALFLVFDDQAWQVGDGGEVSWVVTAAADTHFVDALVCGKDNFYLAASDGSRPGLYFLYVAPSTPDEAKASRPVVPVGDGAYAAAACGASRLFACTAGGAPGETEGLVRLEGAQMIPLAPLGGDGAACAGVGTGMADDTVLVAVLLEDDSGGEPKVILFREDGTLQWQASVPGVSLVHDFVVTGSSHVVVLGSDASQGRPVIVGLGAGTSWRFDPPEDEVVSGILPVQNTGVVVRSRLSSGPGRLRGLDDTGEVMFDLLFDNPIVAWDVQGDDVAVASWGDVEIVDATGSIRGAWTLPDAPSGDSGAGDGVVGVLGFGGGTFAVLEDAGGAGVLWCLDSQARMVWHETLPSGAVQSFSRAVSGDAVFLQFEDGRSAAGDEVVSFATVLP